MTSTDTGPWRRMLYISTARDEVTERECEAILRVSRLNNARIGVTGLLVSGGRRFLQVLEGADDAVATTYERIKDDPRHFALVILRDEPVTARAFPNWAMGHCAGTGDLAADADLAAVVRTIPDPSLRAYFEGFADLHAPRP